MNNSDFYRFVTNGVFSPSPYQPSSPPGGPSGGKSTFPSATQDSVSVLETKRLNLLAKIQQITFTSTGPNKNKTMNSSKLVNLEFTWTDRDYMKSHL